MTPDDFDRACEVNDDTLVTFPQEVVAALHVPASYATG